MSRSWYLAGVALLVSACDASVIIEGCEASEGLSVFCGLDKPEDLEPLGDHPWLMVVELGDFLAGAEGALGALSLIDNAYVRLQAAVADADPSSAFPRCGPPPERLRPRGFHVSDQADGSFRLLVVNAPGDTRIERYRVDVGEAGPAAAWEGCVSAPDSLFPNDVAALSGDAFVVSHMFDPPRDFIMSAKFFFGLDTGYAVAWAPATGWTKVKGTDTSFPNGIEANALTNRVYLASTYGQTFISAAAFGDDAREVAIPVQSDNLTWTPDGRLLAVGHTGIPIFGIAGCRKAGGATCSFPFAVVAIHPETLAQEIVFRHRNGMIPGASVALWHGNDLFMGTVFGDRISKVTLR